MSDKKIQLRIVTPDKTVVEIPVEAVGAIGSEGAFTALPGHVPFLTDLKPGLLWYRVDEETRDLAVSGGFIQILPYQATVLADSAEYIEEIDIKRAEKALQAAQQRLESARDHTQSAAEADKLEITKAEISFAKATNRLKLAGRTKR